MERLSKRDEIVTACPESVEEHAGNGRLTFRPRPLALITLGLRIGREERPQAQGTDVRRLHGGTCYLLVIPPLLAT
jgi:hypothetical protein